MDLNHDNNLVKMSGLTNVLRKIGKKATAATKQLEALIKIINS